MWFVTTSKSLMQSKKFILQTTVKVIPSMKDAIFSILNHKIVLEDFYWHLSCKGKRPLPVTNKFLLCGQMGMVDFQTMPDGTYKYLLNCIDDDDDGTKYGFSKPKVSKWDVGVTTPLVSVFYPFWHSCYSTIR